ncbi:hypothetical protein NDU88_008488 [Pleurodeles waltl]|uniref:Uncharacterized protein n=1 Tax=Pleurodeles waltl TaxID=8319 RepID=A0AAV7RSI4_PLEWA|nr:hypothetical protein NDU88_008488 [Pleurodeles waltl]
MEQEYTNVAEGRAVQCWCLGGPLTPGAQKSGARECLRPSGSDAGPGTRPRPRREPPSGRDRRANGILTPAGGADRGSRSRAWGRHAIQRAQEGGPADDRMRGRRHRDWASPGQTGPVVQRTRHREPEHRCTDSGSATSEGRRHRGTRTGDPRPLSPGRQYCAPLSGGRLGLQSGTRGLLDFNSEPGMSPAHLRRPSSDPQTAKLRKRTCSGAGTRVEERLEAGVTNKHDEGPEPRGPTNRSPETSKSAHRRVRPNWHNNNSVGNTVGPVAPHRLGSAETRAPEEVGLGAALGQRCPVPMGAPNAMGMP